MNKSRLVALERRLKRDTAPAELIELLRELKAASGDDSPTPRNLNLADTLAGIIELLPN